MNEAFVLLGSNMGNSRMLLLQATKMIEQKAGEIKKTGSLYKTKAWGNIHQQDFYNQLIILHTHLSAPDLLKILLSIENKMGRERIEKNEPRLIDLDILFFDNDIINSPELIVPHPLMEKRRFVLTALNEITPGFIHPVLHKPVSQLLLECPDPLTIKKI